MITRKEIVNPPYTIVGHTSLLPDFHIHLSGGGLRQIVGKMKEGESLSITVGHRFSKMEIVSRDGRTPKDKREEIRVKFADLDEEVE